jgi:biopolymer transport protein ExbB
LAGLLVFLERAFFLHRGSIKVVPFLNGIKNLLSKGRIVEAITVCQETPGIVALLAKVALCHYREPEDVLRNRLQTLALVQLPLLERRIDALLTISTVAPLVGLVATCLAFLKSFWQVQNSGPYPAAHAFSAYVISALIASTFALSISAVCYLGHAFLRGRVRAITQDMEYTASELMYWAYQHKAASGTQAGAEPS